MWCKKPSLTLILLFMVLMTIGCGSRFSELLSESLSENYALAENGAEASHIEINDGDIKTWGTTQPPKRDYTITFPEEKKIDRIIVSSGNVTGYQLLCWDSEVRKWKIIGGLDSVKGERRSQSKYDHLQVPRYVHRVNCKTNKLTLRVMKAESDGVVTTRTPGKDDTILNHTIEYANTPRGRVRIDLYDIFKQGNATIREVEAYSYVENPKDK